MKDNRRGRVFIISAPSGTGKSTVIQKLMETRSDLYFSVSATTRPPRPGESDGVSYRFLSHKEFEALIRQSELLEHAEYVGNYYGTPKQPVLDHISRGNDIILDIDVQGCKQVKKAMPEAVTIFIVPPSLEELERRLRYRGTDEEDKMRKRLERAITELGEKDSYDYVVINDSVDRAAQEILDIMAREK
jgi:guanylate kinase